MTHARAMTARHAPMRFHSFWGLAACAGMRLAKFKPMTQETESNMENLQVYIGEGFAGPGVNAAHINIMIGPRNVPVVQSFTNSLSSPSQGHVPFMVVAQPNVPVKPATLYVNKADI